MLLCHCAQPVKVSPIGMLELESTHKPRYAELHASSVSHGYEFQLNQLSLTQKRPIEQSALELHQRRARATYIDHYPQHFVGRKVTSGKHGECG